MKKQLMSRRIEAETPGNQKRTRGRRLSLFSMGRTPKPKHPRTTSRRGGGSSLQGDGRSVAFANRFVPNLAENEDEPIPLQSDCEGYDETELEFLKPGFGRAPHLHPGYFTTQDEPNISGKLCSNVQPDCCIEGCSNSLSTKSNSTFTKLKYDYKYKVEYLKRGWKSVCNQHYRKDLRDDLKEEHQRYCCLRQCMNYVSRFDKISLRLKYHCRAKYVQQCWTKICLDHYFVDKHGNQEKCCVRDCENDINLKRKRYISKSEFGKYRFNQGFLEKGWNRVCNKHERQKQYPSKKRKRGKDQNFSDEPNTKNVRREKPTAIPTSSKKQE